MTDFCECKVDGMCPRYGREMGGRMRELCAGVNVDLGTAAAFREQWSREWQLAGQVQTGQPKHLLLKTSQAPGDAVTMTAAIYSLHRAHPLKYLTAVESYWPDVFAHNPDVWSHYMPTGTSLNLPGVSEVEMHYPAIHQSNERGIHFTQAWCEFLGAALGINIPLMTNRPHLFFKEEATPPIEDYWLVCSGGKRDFTTKLWGQENYQEVVDMLPHIKFVQVGGSRPPVPWNASCKGSQDDIHSVLRHVDDMVGKTTLRQLFEMVRRSRGVLCGVSLLMHVAAALKKPCIVVAGGREPTTWNCYPKQTYLHTVGALPCTTSQGVGGGACWRYRTVPLGDGTMLDRDTCQRPVDGIPECMRMITPAEVANLVLRYNQ